MTPFFLEDVLERTGYVVDPKGDFAVKSSKGGSKGGGGPTSGGGGGSKPGDWQCPSCGDNCFARKTACNRCPRSSISLLSMNSEECLYVVCFT